MEAKYIYIQDQENKQIPQLSEVQINNKVLTCPFYGVIVRSNIDMECLKEAVFSQKLKNTQVVAYHLGDAESFRKKITKTLFEFTGQKLNYKPFSEFVITIDPIGEYLVYDVASEVNKLKLIQDLPEVVRDIFEKKGHARKILIKRLYKDDKKLSGLIEWYLKKSISMNAQINIPPCIPISGTSTLNYAIKTNRIASTIQEDNGWQKAIYFLLDFKAFKNIELIETIINQIRVLNPSIVVFKILNHQFLDPKNSLERTNLQIFLENLYKYRIENKAITFALNTDSILYHFLAQGLCGVIEPISGNYNPDIRKRKRKVDLEDEEIEKYQNFGKYPDPLKLDEKPFRTLEIIRKNNKTPYPCNCPECSKHAKFIKNSFDYNKMRRRHRVFIRDKFISELIESYVKNNLRASIFDRFNEQGSQLGLLRTYYS